MKKRISSLSELVALVRSDKVYSQDYSLEIITEQSMVSFSSDTNMICRPLIEDVSNLCNDYENLSCFCCVDVHGALCLRIYYN